MVPARSVAGLLSSLPTFVGEQRLRGENREVDGEVDGVINGRIYREMDRGVNGGMDQSRLLKVKHVCLQILLMKEENFPPP